MIFSGSSMEAKMVVGNLYMASVIQNAAFMAAPSRFSNNAAVLVCCFSVRLSFVASYCCKNLTITKRTFAQELSLSEMAVLQISSSICSSLDRLCTTSMVYHETVPLRFRSTCGRLQRKNAFGVRASGAEQQNESDMQTRRQVLGGVGVLVASLAFDRSALAAKAPKGYAAVLDNADGYQFFYPFGWQEVAVKGQDVAFKDVIEPLESVSVSIIKTDKDSLQDLGSADQVAKALVERVLASPTQKTQLIEAKERSADGKTYYTFEFLAKAPNYTRHALGTVSIKDGKFYTLTTGANERRWEKMADKLKTVVNSFELLT